MMLKWYYGALNWAPMISMDINTSTTILCCGFKTLIMHTFVDLKIHNSIANNCLKSTTVLLIIVFPKSTTVLLIIIIPKSTTVLLIIVLNPNSGADNCLP